jgi:phage-related protein (TIGR01555 family)
MSVAAKLVHRADSWMNALTGLGSLRDKLTHAQIVPGLRLQEGQLEALYNDDAFAAKIVDKLPRDATRRGFTLEFEGLDRDQSAEVMRALIGRMEDMSALPKLREAWIWGRLYGGGGVFVGADDGLEPALPLEEGNIRDIAFLNVLKRTQLQVRKRYEDVRDPLFGEPELYAVRRTSSMTGSATTTEEVLIHRSRLIMFPGALTARGMYGGDGWDDSVLQRAEESIRQSATAWQSTAHLVADASQGVLKIANLVDLIAAGSEAVLRTRMEMMDMARSVCRSILVDADREAFERVATSFAGLPEMLDRFMMRDAAAAEMPVTLLYGRSPAGLNATGESDIRGWYDTVEDAQNDVLRPRLERLVRLFMLAKAGATSGKEPDNWKLTFRPLWQPTDKERADTKKVKADTVATLVTAQILLAEEGALELAQDGDFSTIDVDVRKRALTAELDLLEGQAGQPSEPPQPEAPTATPANAAGAGADTSVQDTALNGAQVASLLEVIQAVAAGDIPRSTGVQILIRAFQLGSDEAEQLMGEVGAGFKAAPKPQQPPPFGGGLKPPDPKPPKPAPEPADE